MPYGRKENGYTFASLFSGCGGFDLGFVQTGFRCVAAYDIDPHAVAVHRYNLGNAAKECDLSNPAFDAPCLRGLDVIIAGSPCQGFSTAGKREYKDPRNSLLLRAGKIAVAAMPKVFLAENVRGVVAGSHRKYWDGLHRILRSAEYKTVDIPCDAHTLGVPQVRKRIVLLAWRTGTDVTIDLPVIQGGTLREAIGDIKRAPNHVPHFLAPDSMPMRIAPYIRQGHKLCNVRGGKNSIPTWDIPNIFGPTSLDERRILLALRLLRRQHRLRDFGDADPVTRATLQTHLGYPLNGEMDSLIKKGYLRRIQRRFDLTHTFNGKYRRLSWDKPSLTVDTRFGDPRYFLHPDENRGFTVREAARIQGFPDSFLFSGLEKAQFRLIGNAVPPPMGQQIAKWIHDHLL